MTTLLRAHRIHLAVDGHLKEVTAVQKCTIYRLVRDLIEPFCLNGFTECARDNVWPAVRPRLRKQMLAKYYKRCKKPTNFQIKAGIASQSVVEL